MSKHTLGPWVVHEGEDYRSVIDYNGDDVVLDATLSEANARLIAAAPELLELVKEAVNVAELVNADGTDEYVSNFQSVARAAIAKAT